MDDQYSSEAKKEVVYGSRVMAVEPTLRTQDALETTKRSRLGSFIASDGELK